MNENTPNSTKKISRRDAIKLLTAVTGATALANIPSRWSKPGLKIGVLPAHAQTSVAPLPTSTQTPTPTPVVPPPTSTQTPTPTPVIRTLTCDADGTFPANEGVLNLTSGVTISPIAAGISMRYSVAYRDSSLNDRSAWLNAPNPATGTTTTNASGYATVLLDFQNSFPGDTLTTVWSFVNPSDGTGTGTQIFTGIKGPN
jgi:hypothetical protein